MRLRRVFFDHKNFGMIFDYHPHSLPSYLQHQRPLNSSVFKKLTRGLLSGVDYLHQNGVGFFYGLDSAQGHKT